MGGNQSTDEMCAPGNSKLQMTTTTKIAAASARLPSATYAREPLPPAAEGAVRAECCGNQEFRSKNREPENKGLFCCINLLHN
jgi:hypothetical protein